MLFHLFVVRRKENRQFVKAKRFYLHVQLPSYQRYVRMALELTFSCDSDKTDDGPTLIHSTGVESYKIPPDVIRILQDNLSNNRLSDHIDGVLCQTSPQSLLDVLLQNGFTLQNESNDEQKASWTVIHDGQNQDNSKHADDPPVPRSTDENEADGDAADAGDDGGEEQAPDEEAENQEGDEEQENEE